MWIQFEKLWRDLENDIVRIGNHCRIFFVILYGIYRYAFGTDPKRLAGDEEIPEGDVPTGLSEYVHNSIELMKKTPSQSVSIVARDGVKLCGRLYRMKEGAPIVLCFHGYRSSALRDGMGAFQLGYNNGYNVLLLVPGADHGMSYALARKQYQEMLYAFAEKYINKNEE